MVLFSELVWIMGNLFFWNRGYCAPLMGSSPGFCCTYSDNEALYLEVSGDVFW